MSLHYGNQVRFDLNIGEPEHFFHLTHNIVLMEHLMILIHPNVL